MDTKDIECFEIVYLEKSVNRASKKLFITPQGLGKVIRKLETELGTVLFERTQKGLIPTQSAHLFHEKAQSISGQLRQMVEEMYQFENQKKVLRIGCANGIFHVFPLKAIQTFAKDNPDLHVEWEEYENQAIVDRLLDSRLDYGCMVGETKDTHLTQWVLSRSRMVVIVYAGHPFYDMEYITIDMLKNENILSMNEHFQVYHDLIAACRSCRFEPNIAAKTGDGGVLFYLCAQKMGLAVMPDFEMIHYRQDMLHAIPLRGFQTWDVCGTYLTQKRDYENIRKFDDFLRHSIVQ